METKLNQYNDIKQNYFIQTMLRLSNINENEKKEDFKNKLKIEYEKAPEYILYTPMFFIYDFRKYITSITLQDYTRKIINSHHELFKKNQKLLINLFNNFVDIFFEKYNKIQIEKEILKKINYQTVDTKNIIERLTFMLFLYNQKQIKYKFEQEWAKYIINFLFYYNYKQNGDKIIQL